MLERYWAQKPTASEEWNEAEAAQAEICHKPLVQWSLQQDENNGRNSLANSAHPLLDWRDNWVGLERPLIGAFNVKGRSAARVRIPFGKSKRHLKDRRLLPS
jgi:hypothetical protein